MALSPIDAVFELSLEVLDMVGLPSKGCVVDWQYIQM